MLAKTLSNLKPLLVLLTMTCPFLAEAQPVCNLLFQRPWFESTGVRKKNLFSESALVEKPTEMTVTVQDWKNLQTNPEREKARSAAQFKLGDISLPGILQARGQSRFNLFRTRALTFLVGDTDLKVVNRNGGFKTEPKLSSVDQNARVLVEYLIYKVHEVLFKEESVKTRLALITYVQADGKILDKGYGFFLEGKGSIAERLQYEQATPWEFPQDSLEGIPGNIFRSLILDGDQGNIINNFIYLQNKTDPKILKRVAYDFDFSFIAPPHAVTMEDIPQRVIGFRDWLEKSYELGTTGDHQYPPPPSGTKAQQARILSQYRAQIILSAQKMVDQKNQLTREIPWDLLPGDYKLIMKKWFEAALEETQKFISAHKNN
jgi:hypothetical protein